MEQNSHLDQNTVGQMRELLGGKFVPVVRLFLDETQNQLDIIAHALAAKGVSLNITEIMRAAHSLRASSAHIGAHGISAAAAALENGAHTAEAGQTVDFVWLQENLTKSYDQARHGLEHLLGT